MQSLAILHTIDLSMEPQIGPIFQSVYSTVLRDGRHVRGTGYGGLIAALRLLQDELEGELAEAHKDEQRLLLDAALRELQALLNDYIVKHKILAASAEETQRHVAEFYLARTKVKQGSLAIQTRFIGAGSGPTTLFLNGDEVWHGTTPSELLAMVIAHYGSEGYVPVP